MRTVIGYRTHHLSQPFIIRSNSTTITESSQILARIETMTSSITQSTCMLAVELAPMCLSIILHQFQFVFFTKFSYFIRISTLPIKMNNQDSLSMFRYDLFYSVTIYLIGFNIWLYQYRLQSIFRYSKNGSYVCIGRNNNLIAWLHHAHFYVSTKYPYQSIQTVGTAYGVFCSYIMGIIHLELLVLLSLEIPAAIYNTIDSLMDFISILVRNFL